jgi:hypothetical protein
MTGFTESRDHIPLVPTTMDAFCGRKSDGDTTEIRVSWKDSNKARVLFY